MVFIWPTDDTDYTPPVTTGRWQHGRRHKGNYEWDYLECCLLPQVCRALYADTAILVYTQTNFYISYSRFTMYVWDQWISHRLQYQLKAIRHLQLSGFYVPFELQQGAACVVDTN